MTYRVIQWATGAMGRSCLQAVIDHPAMELVGLYVYGEKKEGRDAGDIARRAPTGVIATRDVEAILALEADVVIHCARIAPPYGSHDADILRLLASGKNVISINGYSDPAYWQGTRAEALAAACATGGTTLMAAGLNPGFAAEQLAVVASGLCSALEHVEVVESVDCRAVRQPDYVFKVLGFGADPARVDANDPAWGPASSLNGMYTEVLSAMARHLNLTLERVDTDHRVFAATDDLVIGAGTIARGTVSHINWRWHGVVAGQPRLTMSIHWYMEHAHLGGAEPSLWQVKITGQPDVAIRVDLVRNAADTATTSAEQLAVAAMVVNSIPVVCAAPPGLHTRPLATPFRGVLVPPGRAAVGVPVSPASVSPAPGGR
ncbi:NAD(P)H-dependent amine dehydrogenase family protein [Parapedomonas caeni]